MHDHVIIGTVGLFLAGLLAGEELVIRYGVRSAIDVLDDRSHVELRQALIRNLRVLVPAIAVPATVVAVVVAILDRTQPGLALRYAGLVALVVWMLVTLFGTVPINEAAIEWEPSAPPGNWRTLVARWERLNTVRCWAAVIAFASFSTAVALVLAT